MSRNPFTVMESTARSNAIRRGYAGTEHATATELEQRFAEFDNTCVYCGRSDLKLGPDHDIPITKGGSNAIANILPACLPCNIRKQASTAAEYRERLANPPTSKVYRPSRRRNVALVSAKTDTTPPAGHQRLLTKKEVAAIFSIDPASVHRLLMSGDIRYINVAPTGSAKATIRIEPAEIARFIAARSNIAARRSTLPPDTP